MSILFIHNCIFIKLKSFPIELVSAGFSRVANRNDSSMKLSSRMLLMVHSDLHLQQSRREASFFSKGVYFQE